MWEDYNLEDQSKWTVMPAPSLNSEWLRALGRIAGLNPFGEPVLAARWGATYRDPMSIDNGLKYWIGSRPRVLEGFGFTDPVTGMDLIVKREQDVPRSVLIAIPQYSPVTELGERRWIIERWRSQEFLARSNRYNDTVVYDKDESLDFPFCRNCDAELTVKPSGEPEPCRGCGSRRHYMRTERLEGDGRLLKTDTSKGAYDFFLRLENAFGDPLEADAHALKLIEQAWQQTQKAEKEKLRDMLVETDPQRALNEAATSPTNPFQAPAMQ